MFYYLNGKVAYTEPGFAVIDCNGVGYKLNVSTTTMSKLYELGQVVKLYTYMSIREDAVELFGFYTLEELDIFKLLITVASIGAKSALSILSSFTPKSLIKAISEGNTKLIATAQGIGKKTAERIVVDLRDKVSIFEDDEGLDSNDITTPAQVKGSQGYNDALEALMSLGYQRKDALKALSGCTSDSFEELMRYALTKMGEHK